MNPKVARRQRIAAPLLRDEDLDLTINELARIRERPATPAPVAAEAQNPAPVARLTKRKRPRRAAKPSRARAARKARR